ncbi:MAG: ribonuclease H family protein [Desulfotomaculales bacterium]
MIIDQSHLWRYPKLIAFLREVLGEDAVPDPPLPEITIFCDGMFHEASGIATWAWVAYRSEQIAHGYGRVEVDDSNAAELAAVTEALSWVWTSGLAKRRIEICTDSQACVDTMNGRLAVGLKEHRRLACWFACRIEFLRITWIPRKANQAAHAMAHEAFRKAREGALEGPMIHFQSGG